MQWLRDNYNAVMAWLAATGITGGVIWIFAHYKVLQKITRWIAFQFRLRAEIRKLNKEIQSLGERVAAAETQAAQLREERDKLAKQLEPPKRHEPIEEQMLIVAARQRHRCVTWQRFRYENNIHEVRFDFHLKRLLDAGLLDQAPERAAAYLTDAGNAYLVIYGLVPEPDPVQG